MSGYEVDLKRRREEDTRTIDECEEEVNYLKEQLAEASRKIARLDAEQAKDRERIKQCEYFEQSYYVVQLKILYFQPLKWIP